MERAHLTKLNKIEIVSLADYNQAWKEGDKKTKILGITRLMELIEEVESISMTQEILDKTGCETADELVVIVENLNRPIENRPVNDQQETRQRTVDGFIEVTRQQREENGRQVTVTEFQRILKE
jgi:hypothetical protein